ncbi:MAG: GNAT family N-acetyltransferase [Flavobacteriaceae bacterium]|jgi:RimJ/RimL family protein N-acetyltransferase|nr:GNAT family N-acetyltransferase [Flavobacteriaceae bacterium]
MFSIQPVLENEDVRLVPLQKSDFEKLYRVASDPLIWEQHPNKDRYKKEIFKTFFDGAIVSKGAFLIMDKKSDEIAGSTRFYDYSETGNFIFIGYTFYARKFWGSKLNPQVKKLMLDHIFSYVDLVKFHVGAENWRSRKAMEKLGAEFKGEVPVAYFGEETKLNVEYWIRNSGW